MVGRNKRLSAEEKILQALEKRDGVQIKDLAKKLGMWQGNVSRYVSRLSEKELVEKFTKDGAVCVKLSRKSKVSLD